MKPSARIVFLLMLALLLRTPMSAYAYPMAIGSESNPVVMEEGCHEHGGAPVRTSMDHHTDAGCQIACALAVAPAFIAPPWLLPVKSQSATGYFLPSLNGKDNMPPDTPPPIL